MALFTYAARCGQVSNEDQQEKSTISGELPPVTICNLFLDFKRKKMESKELEKVTYEDYEDAIDLLDGGAHFGRW
jgi:hypothetical protein